MNVLALCAGIGGLELGLHLAEPTAKPVCFVERDKFGQSILAARWPGVPIQDDLFHLDYTDLPTIDIVTAGFPCQPWSSAGLRKGTSDDRWILPEIVNIIRKVGPRFVFLENVAGLLTSGLGHVLGPLAEAGFDAEWGSFSCAMLGGSHWRHRVFILAHSDKRMVGSNAQREKFIFEWGKGSVAHPIRPRLQGGRPRGSESPQSEPVLNRLPLWAPGPAADWSRVPETHWPAQFKVCSVADGVSRHVDEPGRTHRLKALGNAVSPPVSAVAWRVLMGRIGK